ncbi:hypothetical protein Lal_00024860 [Lupinus albus]|uniref:Putative hydrolase n=1 Tax=Lupinus albus TaxID=3870 RepID=A0A6A5NWN3_LUPAL|nr:putative hydrolase [Lupinus albus]KAF1889533.1 hypothetical protein Lal_00024860 [Lupinus albus]
MRRSNGRTRVGSNRNKVDPMLKLQTRSSNPRPNLFARNPKPSPNTFRSHCTFFISLLFILLLFLSYTLFFSSKSNNINNNSFRNHQRYQIIIDGGSTGSRIHVFTYRGVDSFDLGDDGLASMRVSPGLSSFAEDPDSAGRSLAELVEFGKGRVPRESWRETEIRLMATAGLRMVDVGVQGKILESCRKVLRESGFLFRDHWASVITGSDEGMYAWVVANYALGTLGGDPLNTTGIIELGGASAQVTFVSREPMLYGFSRDVKFENTTYNLYSHSLLHFGLNVAHDSWREALISGEYNLASQSLQAGLHIDPCTPTGYSHSVESWKFSPGSLSDKRQFRSTIQTRGNFSECRSAALMLLQKGKEKCSYQRCDIGSTFVPKLQGKILATENFFYTSKFFGLEPSAYLSKLMSAGQEFCGEDWFSLKEKYYSHDEEELLQYCFSSAYIVALLHDGLGIALDDERVKVANQVGNVPLDWALGAFILQITADADVQNHGWMATIFSDESPTLVRLIGILIILLFTAWSISKWGKPQLKTIYDLEKGRYIVTRVVR